MSKETYTKYVRETRSDMEITKSNYHTYDLVELTGIEPATPCLQSRCSPN